MYTHVQCIDNPHVYMYIARHNTYTITSSNCCKRFSLKLSLFNSLSICYDSSIYYPMHLCTYFYNNERHWTPDCSVFWFRERNRNHSSLLSSIPISTAMTYFNLSRLSIHCYHIIIFFDTDLSFIDKANKSRPFLLLSNFCMDRNDYGDWMVNTTHWIYLKL